MPLSALDTGVGGRTAPFKRVYHRETANETIQTIGCLS